ncbi:hypothetical protein Ahy_B01g052231 isoform B [Arachis hypogaea]|uniref:Calcineurin-like phosphoesterase domain-containing protein n=1 Tax=Arachis hypogaea TaxID=3818 RepID=A0A445AP03_ARAHY|nr:hypothetical protein Ahy_B01g052231 isoform B [Arachis hypogaea]
MREEEPSPNASPPLEVLRSSPSPRRGKRSCSHRASHRRASWLPMKEPRELLPSWRRGTREREPSVWSPSQLLSKSSCFFRNPRKSSSGLILFWFSKMSSQEKSLTLGGNEQQHVDADADADAAASCRRTVSLPAQKFLLLQKNSRRAAVSLSFTHRTSVSISQPSSSPPVSANSLPSNYVGDLHGDLKQARYALQMAGVLISDGQDLWTGGEMVLIQVGDILDRDEEEIAILSLLRSLDKQAKAKGGAVFQVLLRGPKNFREAVKHLGLLLVFFTAISSLMYDLREGSLRRLEEGRIAKDLGFKLYYFCIFLQFLVLEFEFEIYFVFEY